MDYIVGLDGHLYKIGHVSLRCLVFEIAAIFVLRVRNSTGILTHGFRFHCRHSNSR
jgi:hypothetical protein